MLAWLSGAKCRLDATATHYHHHHHHLLLHHKGSTRYIYVQQQRPFNGLWSGTTRVGRYQKELGVDDIALVLQQNRLRWYGHVLRKDDDDWVKKCMEHEVEGSRPRGRPKKTWKEVVREDCQARKLNKEDAMDRCKWRKVIKEARWSGWVWVGECFLRYRPTRVVLDQRPLNGRCCRCTSGKCYRYTSVAGAEAQAYTELWWMC